MKLKPIFDRIVLKPQALSEQTKSGLYIPESAVEKPQIATVVAVGDGGLPDGRDGKIRVKIGDNVLYSKFSGIEYKNNDEMFIIVRQGDILAILEDWYGKRNIAWRRSKACFGNWC